MASSRAVRAIGPGALVLAIVMGVWLWLLVDDSPADAGAGSPSAGAVAESPAQAPALPLATQAESEPLPLPTETPADDETADLTPAPTPTFGSVGAVIALSGRVIDTFGQPVPNALVRHLPSPQVWTAVKRHLGGPVKGPPWDELPSTTTGPDGRFRFDVRELSRADLTTTNVISAGSMTMTNASAGVPSLIVLAEGFEATRHVCLAYQAGDFDAGDIVLAEGVVVTGRLLDEQGQPIDGARVWPGLMADAPDDQRYADWQIVQHVVDASSGSDGRFRLLGEWAGRIDLIVEAKGYVPLDTSLHGQAGKLLEAGDLVLARGGTITGWVRDVEGRPVADARVKGRSSDMQARGQVTDVRYELESRTITKSRHEVEVRSEVDGSFVLDTLDQPKWSVIAGAAGFEPAKLSSVAVGTRDCVVTLAPEARLLIVVIDAETGEAIDGAAATGRRTPAGEKSAPFSLGAKLEVLAGQEAAVLARTEREPAGLLLVRGLGDGRNTLVVEAGDYATMGVELPIGATASDEPLTVSLSREAILAGHVADVSGQPVPAAKLTLSLEGDAPAELPDPTATSDAAGHFWFRALAAGTWRLEAQATGFVAGEPLELALTRAQVQDDVVVTLVRGGAIAGVVIGVDGAPAPGAHVKAQPPDADAVPAEGRKRVTAYMAVSDAEGRFRLAGVTSGNYQVTAWPGAVALVDVAVDHDADVVLTLRIPPTVRGRVLDAEGPVAGAIVQCHFNIAAIGAWVDETEAQANEAGEYELVLSSPGTFLLTAEEGGATAAPRQVTVDWDRPVLQDLEFGSERLAGSVVDAETGAPLPGASVIFGDEIALESDGSVGDLQRFSMSSTKTGADGRFETRRLRPGSYTVEVLKKGYAGATSGPVQVRAPADSAGGNGEDELRFELGAGATLSGTVRAIGGGKSVSGLSVNVRIEPPSATSAPAYEKRTDVRDDGTYEKRDMPPGDCVVQVMRFMNDAGTRSCRVLTEKTCVLRAGESTTLDLEVVL